MENVISRVYQVASLLINRAALVCGTVAASLFLWAVVWISIRIP